MNFSVYFLYSIPSRIHGRRHQRHQYGCTLSALLRLGKQRVLPDAGERLGAVLGLVVGGDEVAVSQEGEEPLAPVPVVFDGFRKAGLSGCADA